MKITVENINKIRKAEVNLNGLTVVAGANDSGKSTLSKILFSTIKAVAAIEKSRVESQEILVTKHVRALYKRFRLGNYFIASRSERAENETLFPQFSKRFVEQLMTLDREEVEDFLQCRYDYLVGHLEMSPRSREHLRQDIDNIRLCLLEDKNPAAKMAAEIRSFIESEFINKITSFNTEISSVAMLQDDGTPYLSYEISKENVKHVKYLSESLADFFKDATYIESPLYLHMLEVLRRSNTYFETDAGRMLLPMAPMHIKDMSEKMYALYAYGDGDLFSEERQTRISDVTGGHFVFDENSRRLYFEKNGEKLSTVNVASGIKSFGVLQILLQTYAIGPDKPLLWDEPENHLHPAWQICFADILTQLVKSGIPIVISTHSPYFVQAIRYYSAKYDIEKYVDFYLAEEKEDGLSEIEDVTDDLNRIFTKLAEPLHAIMNIPNTNSDK